METFKTVHGVPTKVICYGKSLEDDLSDVQFLVLVFPGNPGVIDYYKEFMIAIHTKLGEKYPDKVIPIWGVSHAGHQREGLQDDAFPSIKTSGHLYDIHGQINHKIEFTQSYIPGHIRIIGIGHSIGSKTWLEVIKKISEAKNEIHLPQVEKCFMLFPTLERMRATPNGKLFVSRSRHIWLIQLILNLVLMLPKAIHRLILYIVFWGLNMPRSAYEASLHLFHPGVLYSVLHMAKSEIEHVWELDTKTLEHNLDKLFFYFGATDDWMPLVFVDEMKEKLPHMKYQVCDRGVPHAFVMQHSREMADTICSNLDLTEL